MMCVCVWVCAQEGSASAGARITGCLLAPHVGSEAKFRFSGKAVCTFSR